MSDEVEDAGRKKNHVPREGANPGRPRASKDEAMRRFTRELFGYDPDLNWS